MLKFIFLKYPTYSFSTVNQLGRTSSQLKVGIVGMANVGKSSTFNLLSKQNVPAENFPFCTIQPNLAIVKVFDERFDYLVE
jgi:ribosome-binding ATPase YchF (GTP1/OBG family)